MKKLFTVCFIIVVGTHCESPNAQNVDDCDAALSSNHPNPQDKPSENDGASSVCMLDTSQLRVGDGEIIVISDILIDSIGEGERNWVFPLHKSQRVSIRFKGHEVFAQYHDQEILRIQTAHSGIQDVLGNWIVETSIYSTPNGLIFRIDGWGGCDWCTEFIQLVDSSGRVLHVHYHDKRETITQLGDIQSVLEEYAIDRKEFSKGSSQKAIVPSEGFEFR